MLVKSKINCFGKMIFFIHCGILKYDISRISIMWSLVIITQCFSRFFDAYIVLDYIRRIYTYIAHCYYRYLYTFQIDINKKLNRMSILKRCEFIISLHLIKGKFHLEKINKCIIMINIIVILYANKCPWIKKNMFGFCLVFTW